MSATIIFVLMTLANVFLVVLWSLLIRSYRKLQAKVRSDLDDCRRLLDEVTRKNRERGLHILQDIDPEEHHLLH